MTEQLDLRNEVCPYTFIKTKLKLESMKEGDVLKVVLSGRSIENVPRSIKQEGHSIISVEVSNDVYILSVVKHD